MLTYIIFSDLFFNRLRTEQQLGYLVGLAYDVDNEHYYIYQKVQTTFNTDLVQERINEFNLSIIDELKKINLNKWIETLKQHLLKKEESLSDYYSKYYNEIVKQTYIFNRNEILLQNINKVNILDFEKWINKFIIHNKNKTIIISKCK
jgi:secreted Zn-dependent insulinase-like peptidase